MSKDKQAGLPYSPNAVSSFRRVRQVAAENGTVGLVLWLTKWIFWNWQIYRLLPNPVRSYCATRLKYASPNKQYGIRGPITYDLLGYIYRLLDGALAQMDLAFVKEEGIFRRQHVYASPPQRAAQNKQFQEGQRKAMIRQFNHDHDGR